MLDAIEKDLQELTESTTGVVYHVTFAHRVPKIRREGLLTGRKRNWKNNWGSTLGSNKFVYVLTDFSEAVRWAAHMEWNFRDQYKRNDVRFVILEIVAPDRLSYDPDMQPTYSSSKIGGPIPPDRIRRAIPLTLELRRQVVNGGTAAPPE